MSNRFRRSLITSFVVIVGALIIFTASFYFLSLDLRQQADKISADRILISKKTAMLDFLVDLKNNAAQADIYKQAMDKILVAQDQLIDFPRWLDGLSRGGGVAFGSFAFAGDPIQPQGDSAGHINFVVSVGGSFDKIVAFIKDIEFNAPRFLVGMDSFDLRGDGSNYSVAASGKVFFK